MVLQPSAGRVILAARTSRAEGEAGTPKAEPPAASSSAERRLGVAEERRRPPW